MRDLMMTYGILMGKRFRRRDKKIFMEEISRDLKQCGCELMIAQSCSKMQPSSHLIIGNLEKAEQIIACAYDTGGKMLVPGAVYTPFHVEKNHRLDNLNLLLQSLAALALAGGIGCCLWGFLRVSLAGRIALIILALILAYGIYLFCRGIDNKVNFNRNSAAVVLIRQLAETCVNDPQAAFILADHSSMNFTGLKQLAEAYPILQQKLVIWLDCVGIGETLMAACTPAAHGDAEAMAEKAPELHLQVRPYKEDRVQKTSLAFFRRMIVIASGRVQGREFIVESTRTKNDYHIDLERLGQIEQMLRKTAKRRSA